MSVDCDSLMEITQSIVAILIVAGGGFAALTGSSHTVEILPFLGLVIGYYFGRSRGKAENGKSSNGGS